MDVAADEVFTLCNQVVCRNRKQSPEEVQKLTLARINRDKFNYGIELGPESKLAFAG